MRPERRRSSCACSVKRRGPSRGLPMGQDVLVFLECRDGMVKRPSLETLSEGRRVSRSLGGKLIALLAGSSAESLSGQLAPMSPDRVLVASQSHFDHYQSEAHAALLAQASRQTQCGYVFLSATAMGKDLAARAAAKLEAGLASDCIEVAATNGELTAKRPVFSGKAIATVRFSGSPVFVTLRPNVFPLENSPGSAAQPERIAPDFDASKMR